MSDDNPWKEDPDFYDVSKIGDLRVQNGALVEQTNEKL